MIKVLVEAIEKVKKLPEDRQAYAAEVLQGIVADAGDDVFVIPDDHMAGVLEGLAQAERGEFASDKDMRALWKKWSV
jgi:hypothetical protein